MSLLLIKLFRTIQITMHVSLGEEKRSEVVAKIVSECEDRANEEWAIFSCGFDSVLYIF